MTLMLRQLGIVLEHQGRYEEAEQYVEQSLAGFRELGSRANVAFSLHQLGVVAYGQGDLRRARAYCEAALTLARVTGGTQFAAFALSFLGLVACERGDYIGAAAAFAEAFAQGQAAEDRVGSAVRLAGVAVLAVGCGSPESAARLLGAASVQALTLGTPFPLPERTAYERATAAARAALGEEQFAAAWAAGQALAPEEAVAEALTVSSSAGGADTVGGADVPTSTHGLTPRELAVARLVAAGRSNREIADALFVSVPTVKRHLTNVLGKLGLPSRSALNTYAHAHRLV